MIWLLLGIAQATFDADRAACDGAEQTFTLCLAERAFDRSELALNAQWTTTSSFVQSHEGRASGEVLRREQRRWIVARNRACDAVAEQSPVTQGARNHLGCLAQNNERRIGELREMIAR